MRKRDRRAKGHGNRFEVITALFRIRSGRAVTLHACIDERFAVQLSLFGLRYYSSACSGVYIPTCARPCRPGPVAVACELWSELRRESLN